MTLFLLVATTLVAAIAVRGRCQRRLQIPPHDRSRAGATRRPVRRTSRVSAGLVAVFAVLAGLVATAGVAEALPGASEFDATDGVLDAGVSTGTDLASG